MVKSLFLWCVVLLGFSCGDAIPESELVFISKTKIGVPEPSGLTYHNGSLFVVSDAVPFVYKLSLGGLFEQRFSVGIKQLEGITYNKSTDDFVLLSESKRSLTSFSVSKGIGKTLKIKGKQKHSNKGLEGVCYNSKKQSLFVLNEASPMQLLKISSKGKLKKKYDLTFSKDVSGMVYDEVLDVYWVLSDESQALFKITSKGKKLQKFPLKIKKPEGIALDENRRLYIVSDQTSDLFVYQLR